MRRPRIAPRAILPALLLALELPLAPSLRAQEARARAQIDSLMHRLVDAASRADAPAVLAHIAPDAIMGETGRMYAHDSAAAMFTSGFTALRSQDIVLRHSTTTVLSPTLALNVADGDFTETDTLGRTTPRRRFAWTTLWRREHGTWRAMHTHESIGGLVATPAEQQQDAQAGIDSVVARMVAAVRQADVNGIFASFDADAPIAADGRLLAGRGAAMEYYAPSFRAVRSEDVRLSESSVRLLSPTTALYTARGDFSATDTTGATTPRREFAWTFLVRRAADGWRIANAHLSSAASPASAPPITAADVAAVRRTIDEYVRAVMAADWEAFGNVFTDDFVAYPPDGAPVVGRDAEVAWAKSSFPKLTSFVVTPEEITGQGDIAYARGSFRYSATGPDGRPASGIGYFVELHRRQPDGTWKYASLIWHRKAN